MKSRLSKDFWLFNRPTAHRGLWDEKLPENSLDAFEQACIYNYPIEMDVQMSSDGYLMVFHDDNLKRMTGLDADIRDTDYITLKSLRLKNTDCQIPDFDEFLRFINGRVPLVIEVKQQKYSGIEQKIVAKLKNYCGDFVVQSFDPFLMTKIKELEPSIIRGILGSDKKNNRGWKTDFALKWLPLNRKVKPDFINYNVEGLPICRLKSNGLPIICWTVRDSVAKEKAEKYALGYVFENIRP